MKSSLRRRPRNQAQTPVPLATRYNRGHIFDLGAGRQDRETQMRQYGRSGTVFSIVSLLSQSASLPEWHLYEKAKTDGRRRYSTADVGDDMRKEITVHAALKLLRNPNPFQTRFEFFEASAQHLELVGEFFWVLDVEAGFPTSMWIVRPDRMEPVTDPDDFLSGWIYNGPSGDQYPLKLSEVIQEKMPDPLDPYRGMGPVASILPNIEQQRYATEWQRNLFINGADAGGIIMVPNKLTEREFDEFTDRWRESHQGVARAGRIGILENGASWVNTTGTSNKDMDYANLRLANRDELREAWRMHKALLGTVEDVNRANAQTAEEVFVAWMTIPRLQRRKQTLNSKFLPLFGSTGTGVEFDFDDPSPVNQEAANAELLAKAQAAVALHQAGYDPHDILEVVGLPDMNTTAVAGTANPAADTEDDSMLGNRKRVTVYGQAKVSKASVNYREATGARHCGNCAMFLPETGTCDLVAGAIESDDVCDRWIPQVQGALSAKKDPGTKAYQQQLDDYPPGALAWMHHATWTGPVDVPMSHINPKMSWMDEPDPDHVQDFVKRLGNGKNVKPVLLVKTPGRKKLLLVDGHHRYLAAAEVGQPVRGYVGTVSSDDGEWTQMHSRQFARPYGKSGGGDNALSQVFLDGLRPYTARALEPAAMNRSQK